MAHRIRLAGSFFGYLLAASTGLVPATVSARGLELDPSDRASVVALYQSMYSGSGSVSSGWTGDVSACNEGDVTAAYRDYTLRRVNYFRAMAGLPAAVTLRSDWNTKCQKGALMINANRALSHNPPSSWTCYTLEGGEACSKSNIAFGFPSGPDAVTAWILDDGITTAGHRRWVLHPPAETMGFGCTFGGSYRAFVLWVVGGAGTRLPTPNGVAWPPAGYVPYTIVNGLWSFSYAGADFGSARVSVTRGGQDLPVTLHPVANGYADNTLVWTISGYSTSPPAQDVTYQVTVSNVVVSGTPRSFSYQTTVIDPQQTIAGVDDTQTRGFYRITKALPNPFNGGTTIHYELGAATSVSLCVYDAAGRLVRELFRGPRSAGSYSTAWDARDRAGRTVRPGAYYCRLRAGGDVVSRVIVRVS